MKLKKFTIIPLIILISITLTSCAQYQSRECPYLLKQIAMYNSQTGWAVTAENEILFTQSGTKNFKVVKSTPDIAASTDGFLNACFIDDKTAYITYFADYSENLVVEYSEDSGNTWQKTYVAYKNYAKTCDKGSAYISFTENGKGYLLYCSTPAAGMMTKLLFYTEDNGESYTYLKDLTEEIAGYPQGISFTNDKIGYIAVAYHGEDDYLYQTSDSGNTWKSMEIFAESKDVNYIDAFPPFFSIHNSEQGLLVLKEVTGKTITYKLFTTTDSGNSWHAKGKIPTDSLLNYSFVTENEIYVINNLGELYETHI